MESIIANIRIDTAKEIKDGDLKILNDAISDVLVRFSEQLADTGNTCDIGWSWWDHKNVI